MFNVKIFSERLKAARTSKHISQADLAKAVGVSAATISSYETVNGAKIPSLDKAEAIADKLGVSLDWLCGKDGAGKVKISDYDLDTFLRALVVVLSDMSIGIKKFDDGTLSIYIDNPTIVEFATKVQDVIKVYHNGTLTTDLYEVCIERIISNYDDYVAAGGWVLSSVEACAAFTSLNKIIRKIGYNNLKQGVVAVSPYMDPTLSGTIDFFVSEKTLEECKEIAKRTQGGELNGSNNPKKE